VVVEAEGPLARGNVSTVQGAVRSTTASAVTGGIWGFGSSQPRAGYPGAAVSPNYPNGPSPDGMDLDPFNYVTQMNFPAVTSQAFGVRLQAEFAKQRSQQSPRFAKIGVSAEAGTTHGARGVVVTHTAPTPPLSGKTTSPTAPWPTSYRVQGVEHVPAAWRNQRMSPSGFAPQDHTSHPSGRVSPIAAYRNRPWPVPADDWVPVTLFRGREPPLVTKHRTLARPVFHRSTQVRGA